MKDGLTELIVDIKKGKKKSVKRKKWFLVYWNELEQKGEVFNFPFSMVSCFELFIVECVNCFPYTAVFL
jgi:hypothetical protein